MDETPVITGRPSALAAPDMTPASSFEETLTPPGLLEGGDPWRWSTTWMPI